MWLMMSARPCIRYTVLIAVLVLFQSSAPAAGKRSSRAQPARHAGDPRSARVALVTGEVFSASETRRNLRVLCEDIGGRLTGSENARAALDFAESAMRAYGLSNVHQEAFEFPGWFRGAFRCEIIAPRRRAVHALALGNSPSTPPGGVEAEVVDAAHGNPVELDRLGDALRERFALVIDEPMPGGRWMHRSEIMLEVASRGGAGLLFQTTETGKLPMTGTCWNDGVSPIPGVGVSKEDGAWMQRALARGERVVARIEMTNETRPATCANVVGEIAGYGDEFVLVGAHIDSWDIAEGAVDNGTGTVVVLEAARALAKTGIKPRAAIRFVLFTGEESGLYGSNAYAEAHAAELARCRCMINCDMEGTPTGIRVMGHEEARFFFEGLYEALSAFELSTPLSFRVGIYGDQQAFLLRGVPVVIPSSRLEEASVRYYHTAGDTFDKVDLRSLPACAAFVGVLALELAMPDRRPIESLDEAGVEKLILDNHLEEALRAWGSWPREK